MPLIFGDRPGQVVRLEGTGVGGTVRALGFDRDSAIRFDSENAIITGIGVADQANLQMLHAVGGLVHVYLFGDKVGQVSISGIGFAYGCPATSRGPSADPNQGTKSGFELIRAWYRRNRAIRRASPVRFVVGDEAIDGVVASLNNGITDAATGTNTWSIEVLGLPREW